MELQSMNKQPLVSVIMNCLNCEKYLKEAIDSVYAQTYSNWEIIFWDNASTDRSAEIAQSYDDKLRYFRGNETIPLGAARNEAIQQVQGEFIAFLDCDDLWLPEKLEKQIPLFADTEVGLVYSDMESFNQKGDRKKVSSQKKYYRGYCFEQLLINYFLSMPTVIIRKNAVLKQTYAFYNNFQIGEEAELFTRLAYDWKIDYVDEVLAQWRVHSSSATWVRYDLLASENKVMLDLLNEHIPEFNKQFKNAIRQKKAWIDKVSVIELWMKGAGKEARSLILKSSHKNITLIAIYFLSFFSARFMLPLIFRIKGSAVYTVVLQRLLVELSNHQASCIKNH